MCNIHTHDTVTMQYYEVYMTKSTITEQYCYKLMHSKLYNAIKNEMVR